jgi:hypothetical protein
MKIIPNYLKYSIFKKIQDIVFSSYFPLYYNPNDNSDFTDLIIKPILEQLKPKTLLRAKLNCYTKKDKPIYTKFHKDYPISHKVALFSLNTCNGFTYFKSSKNKIKSIENQMLIFNGEKEHCSVNQTDQNLRLNININYIV